VRFSTVVGSKGSADTVRDPRGFSIKFYTGEGNYDLVGNNLPVFFIRDAIKFPDMVHAFKPSPRATFTKTWPEDIFPLTPVGMMVLNKNPENFFAEVEQAGERYHSLDKVGQNHLVGNIVDSLGNAQKPIQKRMLKNLASADPGFGKRVASALKR